ncbi:hypothetical protein D5S18_23680 [Nocardia panacis]|uniref:Uncharacterized protein n=1 Tax=Nocardia panacis TaxID=2340916 RepID=A0A3A4KH50_9NOCA|nr:hypothetical protein D5S18_23680 [Nocardia panacis]
MTWVTVVRRCHRARKAWERAAKAWDKARAPLVGPLRDAVESARREYLAATAARRAVESGGVKAVRS